MVILAIHYTAWGSQACRKCLYCSVYCFAGGVSSSLPIIVPSENCPWRMHCTQNKTEVVIGSCVSCSWSFAYHCHGKSISARIENQSETVYIYICLWHDFAAQLIYLQGTNAKWPPAQILCSHDLPSSVCHSDVRKCLKLRESVHPVQIEYLFLY